MSEYATESPVSLRRRRQRRRTLIVIGVVLLGLFFAFWYALSYYEGASEPGTPVAAAPTCRTPDPDAVTPEQVKIRVLNATNRNGLAAATAKSLGSRGFKISGADNDTSKRKAPTVAEIRYGPKGESRAKLVETVMPDGTKLYNDKRKGTDIDVVLGQKFTKLEAEVTPTTTPLPECPSPSPS